MLQYIFGTYLNIYGDVKETDEESFVIDSYLSDSVEDTVKELTDSKMIPVVIGEGEKVVNQFPQKGSVLNLNNKVFLLTNGSKFKMLDIKGWSRSEVITYTNFLGMDVIFEGTGYVSEFSIEKDTELTSDMILNVTLSPKFVDEVKKQENDKEKKES